MQDFQSIATEAIAQCQVYEAQIRELESQLNLQKKASCADPQLVEKSVKALTKLGSISEQQAAETSQLLSSDPNASLRALNALCAQYTDAPTITKTASVDLYGGSIVKQAAARTAPPAMNNRDQAYRAVAEALGLELN